METRMAVRPMVGRDVATAAETLSLAFFDDPVGMWMCPNNARRQEVARRGFELQIREVFAPHAACTVSSDVSGVALWKPPGAAVVPPLLILRMLPRLGRIFGRRLPLLLRGLNTIEAVHPKEPHHYLGFMGVRPERQNRGIGSALLEAGLARCDAGHMPAYLEASTQDNRRLYARYGFEVTGEIVLPDGPPFWPMWREAR